jgi:hypothetical protein
MLWSKAFHESYRMCPGRCDSRGNTSKGCSCFDVASEHILATRRSVVAIVMPLLLQDNVWYALYSALQHIKVWYTVARSRHLGVQYASPHCCCRVHLGGLGGRDAKQWEHTGTPGIGCVMNGLSSKIMAPLGMGCSVTRHGPEGVLVNARPLSSKNEGGEPGIVISSVPSVTRIFARSGHSKLRSRSSLSASE